MAVRFYVAFWLFATVLIIAECRESMGSVLSAVGLRVVRFVAVPAAGSLLVNAAANDDSTAEFIQSERAVRGAALAEANRTQSALHAEFAKRLPANETDASELYFSANPQLDGSGRSLDQLLFFNQLARYAAIEERLRPLLRTLETQDQNRGRLVAVIRWASPAVAMHLLLEELAGTSRHRLS